MNPTNQFAAWLKLYDDNNGAPQRHPFGYGVFGGGGAVDDNSGRMLFARDMMNSYGGGGGTYGGAPHPDFFGAEPRNAFSYVAPDRFNDTMPAQPQTVDPLRPMIRNYIARMIGGR